MARKASEYDMKQDITMGHRIEGIDGAYGVFIGNYQYRLPDLAVCAFVGFDTPYPLPALEE